MRFRARSLRVALCATALMTAVTAPAAAQAARTTTTAAGTSAVAKSPVKPYNLKAGPAAAPSRAWGQFLTWTNTSVTHHGKASDKDKPGVKAYNLVAFQHYRLDGSIVFKTFMVDNALRSTNYVQPGRFVRVRVTDCKVTVAPKAAKSCVSTMVLKPTPAETAAVAQGLNSYDLRAGPLFGPSKAKGSILWAKSLPGVKHHGVASDTGHGHNVVTFYHYRPQAAVVVRKFAVNDGQISTNYTLSPTLGTFTKIVVRDCKKYSPTLKVCKTKVFT